MSELATLIKCLPAILGLIKAIQDGIEEAKVQSTVNDHIEVITKAFEAKDANQLNAIFNGQ